MGTNIFLVSGSSYVTAFRWHLKQCGVHLISAEELISVSSLRSLDALSSAVLDCPLGISNHVRSACEQDRNYIASSWSAWMQSLSGQDSWQAFCPWLWLRSHVIKQLSCPVFEYKGVKASSEIMPFYLIENQVRKRQIAVRYQGVWHGDQVSDRLVQSLDRLFCSQLLTVECVLQDGRWCFLQTYPGLPWGHYVKKEDEVMHLLANLFQAPKANVTIARRFRPFC